MALLFCAWIGVLVVLNWSFTLPVGTTHHHVDAFAVVALYVGGGIAAGAVVGLMRPLERTLAGAMFTGSIAALPVFAGASLIVVSSSHWNLTNTIVTFAGAFGVGPFAAALIRDEATEMDAKPQRER